MKEHQKVTVIDSIMGSGKTTWAFKYIKDNPNERFIYVTPFLSEVERVTKEVGMVEPIPIDGSKLNNVKDLLWKGQSFATTHSMLCLFDREMIEYMEVMGYNLILDEVIEIAETYSFPTIRTAKEFLRAFAYIDEEGYVVWNEDICPSEDYTVGTPFYTELQMCKNKTLFQVRDNLFMWEFPISLFRSFKQVFLMTFMFEGSSMKPYFDMFGLEYVKKTIQSGKLVGYQDVSREEKEELASLINIIDNVSLNFPEVSENITKEEREKLTNEFGKGYPLSATWYDTNVLTGRKNDKGEIFWAIQLKNNLSNYFLNITKAKSSEIMWATFSKVESLLKGKGYTKSFVPYNSRATNEFKDCSTLAYMVDVHPHINLNHYFSKKGTTSLDRNKYALATLLQWVWRSRIRQTDKQLEDRKINLYLPSSRMRHILKNWLNK